MHTGLHVKYHLFLSNFDKTLIFSTDFRKKNIQISDFTEIHPFGTKLFHASGQTDRQTVGRTDGPDEANIRFQQLCRTRPKTVMKIRTHKSAVSNMLRHSEANVASDGSHCSCATVSLSVSLTYRPYSRKPNTGYQYFYCSNPLVGQM